MKNKTVLLGMSGGVDSSVAALLLKKQGYNVIGAFMKNFSDSKNKLTGECAWVEERRMALKIATQLNIPLRTLNFEKEYKKDVINPMFSDYKKGITPNPDIVCNKKIKFPLLWQEAKKINADYIATGHYARIKKTKKNFELLAGKDKFKDQSYFLCELNQNDLSHTLFPIGDYTKEKVRKIAKENNFPNFDKKGTSGICFVGKVNMKSFLGQKIKEKKGKIIDPQGNDIGTHPGIMFYTIGQRIAPNIGLDIIKEKSESQKKYYIAQKIENNILIAAPQGHSLLKRNQFIIKKMHLINPNEKIPIKVKVRIRHLGKFIPCKIKKIKSSFQIQLSKPQEGIAEGQSAVFYMDTKVIGSGEISLE